MSPKSDEEPQPSIGSKPGEEPQPSVSPKEDEEPQPSISPTPDEERQPSVNPKPDEEPQPSVSPKPDEEPQPKSDEESQLPTSPKADEESESSSSPEPEEESPPSIKLTYEYLRTFSDKLENGKRELMLRGNDLVLRTGCRLTDEHVPAICEYLANNPEVVAADLAYNCIGDNGIEIFADFFREHDSLRRLNLMCNEITARGVGVLAALGDRLSLTSLRINGNLLGQDGGERVCDLLLQCGRLEHLDLGETRLSLADMAWVLAGLRPDRGGNGTLRAVELCRPLGFWRYGMDSPHWAYSVGQLLRFNSALRELHLQKCELDDGDMELLMVGARHNRSLLLLDLTANRLADDGAARLGCYLQTTPPPPLRVLLLAHNRIADDGARSLSFTMPSSHLKMLDISFNKISDTGMMDILNTIKKPFMLETLYIYGNKITPKSIKTLQRLLLAGTLTQSRLDVRVWRDREGRHQLAQLPTDRRAHIYYCVPDFATPQPRWFKPPRPDVAPTLMAQKATAVREGGEGGGRRRRGRAPPRPLCPAGALLVRRLLARAGGHEPAPASRVHVSSLALQVELPGGRVPSFLRECDHAFWGVFEHVVPAALRDCVPPHDQVRAPPLPVPPPRVYPHCFNFLRRDDDARTSQ